jgi:hypothetical protein
MDVVAFREDSSQAMFAWDTAAYGLGNHEA